MPSIDDVFAGKTLKSEQLKGKPPAILTIAGVEITEFQNKETGKKEKKLAISFRGTDKVLICNLINANMIADLAGDRDYDKWVGTQIKLVVERVPFGAKIVDGIRVKDPSHVDKIETGVQKSTKDEMADEIPF